MAKRRKSGASAARQAILTIAIAIVLALFVGFGIHTFYEAPNYPDYCGDVNSNSYGTQQACEAAGGRWSVAGPAPVCPDGVKCAPPGYCQPDYSCSNKFQADNDVYSRNVFIIAAIAGLIALLLGGIVLKLETVAVGLMGGGVLSIIYGVIRYWNAAPNFLRFIILGVILFILIWLSYRKLNPAK